MWNNTKIKYTRSSLYNASTILFTLMKRHLTSFQIPKHWNSIKCRPVAKLNAYVYVFTFFYYQRLKNQLWNDYCPKSTCIKSLSTKFTDRPLYLLLSLYKFLKLHEFDGVNRDDRLILTNYRPENFQPFSPSSSWWQFQGSWWIQRSAPSF